MVVGNEALESGMWNSAWRQIVNITKRYMECILHVKNYKHDDDVNSGVKPDMFILYRNCKYYGGEDNICVALYINGHRIN
jgi:hypothetical protein